MLSDILGTEEDTIYRDLENEAERKLLVKAIGRLSNRERMIVRMRFGLGTLDGEEKNAKKRSLTSLAFHSLIFQDWRRKSCRD